MKKNKLIETGFEWATKSRFPREPENKPENPPWLWLCRIGSDLYLVNSSGDVLDEVSANSGGMQTIDNSAITLESNANYSYQNVKPNQAVKVDEYDDYYDLDALIQVYITVRSPTLGNIKIRTPLSKGGIDRNTALLWSKTDISEHVGVVEL